MKFSERIGKKTPRTSIQLDSIDMELRNSLWNIISAFLIEPMEQRQWLRDSGFKNFVEHLWFSFFKEPTDHISGISQHVTSQLRKRFFEGDYLYVYDFIDFLASSDDPNFKKKRFIEAINFVLKRELSGYRLVNDQLVPITSEGEILEIEKAFQSTSVRGLNGVSIHLAEALSKLSDKRNPDYRNSIKESISALESLCKSVTGGQ